MTEILFICEHGSAKSVVAAAHFNDLAAESGLPVRAISRGTDPDDAIHPAALRGLALDGLGAASAPVRLSDADLDAAQRVVSFSDLPPEYNGRVRPDIWTVPAVSENYESSRDAIVTRVRVLIGELTAK